MGTCVDEQTDNNNCGGCGQVCTGTCTGGRCLITLSTGGAYAVAVDSTTVYWTAPTIPAVLSVPIAGGTPQTLATAGLTQPTMIAVTGGIYVADPNPNTGTSAVLSIPPGGGLPTTLASGQAGITSIAADGTNVYWVTQAGGTVVKEPVDGGLAVTLWSSASTSPYGIAVDSTNVYWTFSGNPGAVMRIPIAGGTAATLANVKVAVFVAVDSTNVYWVDQGAGTVATTPITGGPIKNLAIGRSNPTAIAVYGGTVYWSDDSTSLVLSVPSIGGPVTTLASGQSSVVSIAADATSVYWTSPAIGTVMKLTPR